MSIFLNGFNFISHDRFLCINDTVYHIGASLKDLGKKWFAFSRMVIGAEALRGKNWGRLKEKANKLRAV